MRILITGAGGFIGAHLTNYLVKNSKEEHIYYLLIHNIQELDFMNFLGREIYDVNLSTQNIKVFLGDINNYKFLERFFLEEDIDLVIHLAAQAIVSKAEKNRRNAIRTNIHGTTNVLELVKQTCCKMIYQSTDKVYGNKENASINDPIAPVDFYGITKASAEMLVNFYQEKYSLDIIILRPCNIFGLDPNLNRLIPDIITKCIHDKNPIIHPAIEGEYPIRQYLYIQDYCSIVAEIIRNWSIMPYVILNIDSSHIYTTKNIAETILESFPNQKLQYKEIRTAKEITNQYMKQNEQGLPFRGLERNFHETIGETIDHYRKWMKR